MASKPFFAPATLNHFDQTPCFPHLRDTPTVIPALSKQELLLRLIRAAGGWEFIHSAPPDMPISPKERALLVGTEFEF